MAGRVVPFFVSFMSARRNGAPFLSARFLVSFLSHRGVCFPGVVVLRPVRRLVGRSVFTGRLVRRLV